MSGMSSAIADLIIERPLCLRCLATKLATPEPVVEQSLDVIARTFRVHRVHRCCDDCGEARLTVSMMLPAPS
jgi:hypothetical protein